jgi:predicted metal-binding protein
VRRARFVFSVEETAFKDKTNSEHILPSERWTMSSKSSSVKDIEALFEEHGFDDYKWINPKDIIVSQWVRMKCTFGCSTYGKCASCPPNTPSVSECRDLFDEYNDIAVFHIPVELDHPDDRHELMKQISSKLLKLERAVFLSGYVKAFMLPADNCSICDDCVPSREDCKQPALSRPPPEAMGVDVFSTVRAVGYPIEVLADYDRTMNRYAFLLVR